MRVLMVSWEYPPHVIGGMGKHVMELAPALAAQQVEVHVLTPLLRGGKERETTPEGVQIHRIPPAPMEEFDFSAFAQQTNALLERAAHVLSIETGGFDLIHVHDWLTAYSGITLKHAWRLPLIATIHATERGRHQGYLGDAHAEEVNQIEWWLTYEAWRVITCSDFMSHQIRDYFHTPVDKIDVVPNGVHVPQPPFATETQQRAFRQRYVTDGQPLVFYVGRVVYEKGLQVLLEAWPQVLATYPDARLFIAGTGNYLDALKSRAWEMGLGNRVVFTGYISDQDRDRLYHVADAAVFPSLYEPFGIVALEAMAACCPVVVTHTGGLNEVVRLHETGITVHPNNPDSLAWGICHTLAHPHWSYQRAANALNEVRSVYNWDSIAIRTLEIYQRTHAEWQRSSWGSSLMRRDA